MVSPEQPRSSNLNLVVSTALWRILGTAFFFAGAWALGRWAQEVDRVADFSTIMIIIVFGAISHWAAVSDRETFTLRFGPFAKIAQAVSESQKEIRQWAATRPLRVGVIISALYGLAVVLGRNLIAMLVEGLANRWLAISLGLLVLAVVAAPELFRSAAARVSLPKKQTPDLPSTISRADEDAS